jgi:hypothetical protein
VAAVLNGLAATHAETLDWHQQFPEVDKPQ